MKKKAVNEEIYDIISERIDRQFREKKLWNILICAVIVILGAASIWFIFWHDGDGWLTFRWLTVDGTMFTVLGSVVVIVVNVVEILKKTEVTAEFTFFVRLSCAVAESVIALVVLASQAPFFSEHMHLWRFDMFNMHVLIPVLTIVSFVINDAPIGRVTPMQRFHGTWYVTCYACIIIPMILSGRLPTEMIPYFFLDFYHVPLWLVVAAFVFVYGCGYLMSWALIALNRRLSWSWFRDVARKLKGKR